MMSRISRVVMTCQKKLYLNYYFHVQFRVIFTMKFSGLLGVVALLIVLWQFSLHEATLTPRVENSIKKQNMENSSVATFEIKNDKNNQRLSEDIKSERATPNALEEYLTYCRDSSNQNATQTSLAHSKIVLVENSKTGSTIFGQILSYDSLNKPTCRTGDLFEITSNSSHNKLPVKTLSHHQPGVYEFSFKPIIPGTFSVCLYLFYSGHLQFATWPTSEAWNNDYTYETARKKRDADVNKFRKKPTSEWCPAPDAEYKKKCTEVEVSGKKILPEKVCGQHWDAGLHGSWVKSNNQKCSPGICVGDLPFFSTDGWVYVPEDCYLRLYNQRDAWTCLDKKKLLFFGDSTLKQPTTNLIEQLLGVPVLRKSFNWIRKNCPSGSFVTTKKYGKKYHHYLAIGCASQFEHRQWNINRKNPKNTSQSLSVQFVWGGGRNVADPPWTFPKALALLNRSRYGDQRKRSTFDVFEEALQQNPDFVLLHSFMWDENAKNSFVDFKNDMSEVLKKVSKHQNNIHWDTGHPQCLDDRISNAASVCQSALQNKFESVVSAHNSHLVINSLASHSLPGLTATDRYTLASPLAIGPFYCHFGIHFGAHKSFCHMWQPSNPQQCYRNWMADKFEIAIWMNKMCSSLPGADITDPQLTIETGVDPEPVEQPVLDKAF